MQCLRLYAKCAVLPGLGLLGCTKEIDNKDVWDKDEDDMYQEPDHKNEKTYERQDEVG